MYVLLYHFVSSSGRSFLNGNPRINASIKIFKTENKCFHMKLRNPFSLLKKFTVSLPSKPSSVIKQNT